MKVKCVSKIELNEKEFNGIKELFNISNSMIKYIVNSNCSISKSEYDDWMYIRNFLTETMDNNKLEEYV